MEATDLRRIVKIFISFRRMHQLLQGDILLAFDKTTHLFHATITHMEPDYARNGFWCFCEHPSFIETPAGNLVPEVPYIIHAVVSKAQLSVDCSNPTGNETMGDLRETICMRYGIPRLGTVVYVRVPITEMELKDGK